MDRYNIGKSLVNILITITLNQDMISPPLSSKIIKFLIDSNRFLGFLKDLSLSRDKYKPLFISNLFTSDGERIYSIARGETFSPKVLRGGEQYFSRISFVSGGDISGLFLRDNLSGRYEIDFGGVRTSVFIDVLSIEIYELDSLRIDLSDKFMIRFVTPTILSPKLVMPPSLADKPRYKRLSVANLLFPVPGAVIAYSMKLWNNIAPPDKRFTYPNDKDDVYVFKTAILGTVFTEVIDYRIRPETVVIGRDSSGRLRKTRGFKGYMIMKINHPRIRGVAERTLALANHLGIGRSRGIGLGEVEIETINK